MGEDFHFECATCGEVHRGLPAWHFALPAQALAIPSAERAARVAHTDDDCVIDGREFYLRGLLELPVQGSADRFTWGVWLSVSEASYEAFAAQFQDVARTAGAEYFGWFCSSVPGYPETQLLKAQLHVREYPMRPWVELEPTEHPLAVDQRIGISWERAADMTRQLLHPNGR